MRRRCEALVTDAALRIRSGRSRSRLCSRDAVASVRVYEGGRRASGPPRLIAVRHYCGQHLAENSRHALRGTITRAS